MEIINFNHVDPTLDPQTLKAIEDLYIYYHRLAWCYKKNHKIYSIKEKFYSYGGIVLICIGSIVGGITVNPINFTVIDSVGALLITISVKGKFAQKSDRSRLAYIEFEKQLKFDKQLKNHRRGRPSDREQFIKDTSLIEEHIINEAPILWNWISKNYEKKFKYSELKKKTKILIIKYIDEKLLCKAEKNKLNGCQVLKELFQQKK